MHGVIDMKKVTGIETMLVGRAGEDQPAFVTLVLYGQDANLYVNTEADVDRLQSALDEARALLTAEQPAPRTQQVRADRVEVGQTVLLDADTVTPFPVEVARMLLDDETVVFTGSDGLPYTFVRSEMVTRVAPLAAVTS